MMKTWHRVFLILAGLVAVTPSLHAQAAYAANRTAKIDVGAGLLYLYPDYTTAKIEGASFWADYDFSKYVGAEVEVNLGSINTPDDILEDSYLVGPRVFLYRKHKFTFYGKLVFGRSTITDTESNYTSSYNTYAFGAGVEYQLTHKFLARFDFENQKWPNFEPNTLSPTLLKLGVSYIIK